MKAGFAQAESCCVYVKPEKFMQHMHDITPKLFYCWADLVAHLLLLKSSMVGLDGRLQHGVDQFEVDRSRIRFINRQPFDQVANG